MTKRTKDTSQLRIALLIDGDNAQPALIEKILTEAGKNGAVTIRRIYGDWTRASMKSWKNVLNSTAIQPIHQFSYTKGKNATDSAMIIDAMDILHGDLVDGFCLVSSDSDYTRLATRIREEGFFVMGIGKEMTPQPFVKACNLFIYTENLMPKSYSQKSRKPVKSSSSHSQEPSPPAARPSALDPIPLLKGALEMAMQEDGWANLATLGFYLHQLDPGFDPRTYGFKQLSQLLRKFPQVFELTFKDESGQTVIYARARE
jgi:uncharacterized LabA/DUF88 family protein